MCKTVCSCVVSNWNENWHKEDQGYFFQEPISTLHESDIRLQQVRTSIYTDTRISKANTVGIM